MINRFFFLLFFIFILTACTKTPLIKSELEFPKFKTIKLNVFDFNLLIDEKKYKLSDELGFESYYLVKEIVDWGNKKFKVYGKTKSVFLTVEEFSLEKKNIKRNKGLKKIFFNEEEIKYALNIKVSCKFFEKDKPLDSINLNGNINFIIKDNFTITQKKNFLSSAYFELIRKIDAALDRELNKKIFLKFKFNQ